MRNNNIMGLGFLSYKKYFIPLMTRCHIYNMTKPKCISNCNFIVKIQTKIFISKHYLM